MSSRIVPFPFPIQVGTDICHTVRIYRILSSARREAFLRRILIPAEMGRAHRLIAAVPAPEHLAYTRGGQRSSAYSDPERRDPKLWRFSQFVAGRFAAKEAVIKAHPHRRLTFQDIVIAHKGMKVYFGEDAAERHDAVVDAAVAGENDFGGAEEQRETQAIGDGIPYSDLPHQRWEQGPPVAIIRGKGPGTSGQEARISISHDGEWATAVCLGFIHDTGAGNCKSHM